MNHWISGFFRCLWEGKAFVRSWRSNRRPGVSPFFWHHQAIADWHRYCIPISICSYKYIHNHSYLYAFCISAECHISKSPAEVSAKPDWFRVRMASSTWDLWCTTRKQRSHIPRRKAGNKLSRAAGNFCRTTPQISWSSKMRAPLSWFTNLRSLAIPTRPVVDADASSLAMRWYQVLYWTLGTPFSTERDDRGWIGLLKSVVGKECRVIHLSTVNVKESSQKDLKLNG